MDLQDAVYEAQSRTAVIIVIADGVSACANGAAGAKTACRAVSDIMLNETEYIFSSSKEKAAGLLSAYVYKKLSELAYENDQPVKSYSSTLSFVCYNKISREIMTFVLGDSLIYQIENGNMRLACKPGLSVDSAAYTTTTENAADVTEINVFASRDGVRYLLATDGAWRTFYSGGVLAEEAERAVIEEKLIDYLESRQCTDDCSIVMMDVPKGA